MATVSFTLPMTPMMISAAKKSGGVLGFMLNVVVLVALIAFIWWFYKAMQKSAMAPAPPKPKIQEDRGTPGITTMQLYDATKK